MAGETPPTRLLLVEGADDEHVVRRLCGRHNGMPEFAISDKKGFSELSAAIGPEIKAPGRTALGILVDANTHPDRRWQAVRDRVRQAAIDAPAEATATGTVITGRPRVGIWLMPDNRLAGELEDFVERLIPAGDPVWPRAQQYIDGIPAADRRFATNKTLRAKVHAWLATRAEPRKMGAAIGAGDLNAADPLARQFVDWLRQLFG